MFDITKFFEKHQEKQTIDRDDRILIIDGLNTWIRVSASIAVVNENGSYVGGIIGFLRSVASNIREFNASRCIIVFDGKGGSLRRRKMFADYKANRTGKFKPKQVEGCELNDHELQDSMKWQLHRTLMYLTELPVQIVCVDHIEADDAIAHICKGYFEKHENKIRIVSTDRDFLQLVDDQIEVYSPVKKVLYTKQRIQEELEICADNYLLYRTLTGDHSDNIPGIKGLGLKTLLKSFPELLERKISHDELFKISNENRKQKKIYQVISDSVDQIKLNHQLMQLGDVDISGQIKIKINGILDKPINKTNRVEFKKLLIEDYIHGSFKNPDEWLYNSFAKLNVWATTT